MDQWRAGAGLRWMRAAVLAASGVLGGSLFHVAADGGLPGPPGLLAIWVVSTVAVAPLLGAELGPYRVVALLVAWQAGVHAILGVLADRGPGVQAVASKLARPSCDRRRRAQGGRRSALVPRLRPRARAL